MSNYFSIDYERDFTKGLMDENATTQSLLDDAAKSAIAPTGEAAPSASNLGSSSAKMSAFTGVAGAAMGVVEAFDQAEMNNAQINKIEKELQAGQMLGVRSSGRLKAAAAVTGDRAALGFIENEERQKQFAAMRDAAMATSQLKSDTTAGFVSSGMNLATSVVKAGDVMQQMPEGSGGVMSMFGGMA